MSGRVTTSQGPTTGSHAQFLPSSSSGYRQVGPSCQYISKNRLTKRQEKQNDQTAADAAPEVGGSSVFNPTNLRQISTAAYATDRGDHQRGHVAAATNLNQFHREGATEFAQDQSAPLNVGSIVHTKIRTNTVDKKT